MASPVFQSATSATTTTGTSLTIPAPAGIVSGDLLIAFVGRAAASSTVVLAGWTVRSQIVHDGGAGTVLTKTAASESGSYTFTWAGGTRSYGGIIRVNGWEGTTPFIGTTPTWTVGSDSSPDPPATATNPSADYLDVVFISQSGKSVARFTAPPAGMTTRVNIGTTGAGNPADHGGVGVFTAPFTGVSEDRGPATSDTNDGWAANALVIGPLVTAPAITGTSINTETPDTAVSVGQVSSPIIGTVNVTEQADTGVAVGAVVEPAITGSVAVSAQADTAVGVGVIGNVGTSTNLEQADTSVGTGTVSVPPVTGIVEDLPYGGYGSGYAGFFRDVPDTAVATGTVVQPNIIGDSDLTEQADTATAAGVNTEPQQQVTGTTAVVEQADTAVATGAVVQPPITGTVAASETGDTASAAGINDGGPGGGPTTGTSTATESADTATGIGAVVQPPITGTVVAVELADTSTTAGTVQLPGTVDATEQADTATASGVNTEPPITGAVAVSETADTGNATGTVTLPNVTGTATPNEQPDTAAAAGVVVFVTPATGTVTSTLAADTANAVGVVVVLTVTGTIDAFEQADTPNAAGLFTVPIFGTVAVTEQADTSNTTTNITQPFWWEYDPVLVTASPVPSTRQPVSYTKISGGDQSPW